MGEGQASWHGKKIDRATNDVYIADVHDVCAMVLGGLRAGSDARVEPYTHDTTTSWLLLVLLYKLGHPLVFSEYILVTMLKLVGI